MKIKTKFDWNPFFDWIIIPTIMVGFRTYGIGLGVLWLKGKADLAFRWAKDTRKTES